MEKRDYVIKLLTPNGNMIRCFALTGKTRSSVVRRAKRYRAIDVAIEVYAWNGQCWLEEDV